MAMLEDDNKKKDEDFDDSNGSEDIEESLWSEDNVIDEYDFDLPSIANMEEGELISEDDLDALDDNYGSGFETPDLVETERYPVMGDEEIDSVINIDISEDNPVPDTLLSPKIAGRDVTGVVPEGVGSTYFDDEGQVVEKPQRFVDDDSVVDKYAEELSVTSASKELRGKEQADSDAHREQHNKMWEEADRHRSPHDKHGRKEAKKGTVSTSNASVYFLVFLSVTITLLVVLSMVFGSKSNDAAIPPYNDGVAVAVKDSGSGNSRTVFYDKNGEEIFTIHSTDNGSRLFSSENNWELRVNPDSELNRALKGGHVREMREDASYTCPISDKTGATKITVQGENTVKCDFVAELMFDGKARNE